MYNNYRNPIISINNRGQQSQYQNGLKMIIKVLYKQNSGIQSLMGIQFSAIQLFIFGQLLIEKTKKLLEFIKSGTITSINKFLTLLQIKQFLKGELTKIQIVKSVENTSTQIGKQLIIAIRLLLLVVILLIGVLLAHMKKKIKEKQEIEIAQKQQDIEKAEQQQQLDNEVDASQIPIQQNDFWNHIDDNTSIEQQSQQQQQQQQQSNPIINYLNDLPGFSNSCNTSKPWMK